MEANVRRERPGLGGVLLAAGLLVVLVLWFGRACWGGWWPAPAPTSSDTFMLSTIYERWAVQVGGGHLPLWFPEFAGGGYPVHAAWMYGLFYPPLALFLALPPEVAWTWLAILHIVFGGLGMYAFLWDERRDVAAAASGAIVFALSYFMLGRIVAGHINIVMPFAWAPWVLRAALRTVRGERGAAAWLGLTTALGLLAGHVQVWFYVAPVVAAYALFEARATGRLKTSWKPLAVGAALALGITAIQWLPAWELFSVSGHPSESLSVVTGCSAPASALVAQLAPRLSSSDEQFVHEFSGLGGPLAVAAVLFSIRLREPKRWFWLAVLVFGLVLAVGLRNDVSRLANELPPFRFARAPGRALLLVVLAGGVLAAHAVADVVAATAKWRPLVPAAFVASALAFGVPWIDVVKSDFYDFDWARLLPAGAASHKVHVLHGRYPYPERSGVATLRDVCPLDTPGYKALTKEPSPAIAWWFDMATQIGTHVEPRDWTHAPADLTETQEVARNSVVNTYDACGPARQFGAVADWVPDEEVVARLRAGERTLFLPDPFPRGSRNFGVDVPTRNRIAPVPTGSPAELEFNVEFRDDPGSYGWIFIPSKWYPGWSFLDDSAGWQKVERANLAFIAVPNLYSRLELSYRPWWLWPALTTSLGSLVAAVVIVVRSRPPAVASPSA